MTDDLPTRTHAGAGLTNALTLGFEPAETAEGVAPAGFELFEQVGAGGMGVVNRARDLSLEREVAIKLLAGRYTAESVTAQRFLDEARITAQLQHPSIPAVYQVGRTPDGRPYLAMKLICGKTLDRMLKDGGVNTLAVIEAVAQAVGYAHSQGIVHRDLKPANVMVGAFGEVQVMDWGLAKSILPGERQPSEPASDETFVPPEVVVKRGSDSSLTQAGAVMGTLGYMPPEQAAGEIEKIDGRADVFGLGAILCTMLTGKPPYEAAGPDAMRLAAIRGDTATALRRLDGCGADPGVIALCKACLSFQPDDRPRDGLSVAEAVARLRADSDERARQAEVGRARAAVEAAEQRKRRRMKRIGLAVTFAVFAVGIVGTSIGMYRANTARAVAETAERGEAAQRVKAQERLKKAVDAVEKIMARISAEKWSLRPELQDEKREMLAEAVEFFRGFDEADSRDPYVRRQTARAHLLTMSAYMALADYDNCRRAADTALDLYRGLVADDAGDEPALRGTIDCLAMRGHLAAIAGRYGEAERDYQAGLAAAEAAAAASPSSEDLQVAVADMHTSLGLFNGMRRPDRMIRHHEAALRIGEQLLRGPTPGYRARLVVFMSLINLAANMTIQQPQAALKMFDRANALLPYLESHPAPTARSAESFLITRSSLNVYRGALLYRAERRPGAVDAVRTGVGQMARLLNLYPKSFPILIHWMEYQVILADVLIRDGKIEEAERLFAELDERRRSLLDVMPSAAWLERIGTSQRSGLLVELARTGQAAVVLRQAERLLESEAMLNAADGISGHVVRYNVACVYAQLAERADPERGLFYAHRAVELLEGLKTGNYFSDEKNVIHLDRDTDFNPIRDYGGYKAFRTALPTYREAAPPPRPAVSR